MNIITDFYSKPSNMSAYHLYGKTGVKQRGGFGGFGSLRNSYFAPGGFYNMRKKALNATAGIVSALHGLNTAVKGYKYSKNRTR